MIPAFPEFKEINLDDRQEIESHTHRYRPYSDFNFTNLWAWDTKNRREISILNGNLVVLFTDYITNEPSLSFLGPNDSDNTARQLLQYAEKSDVSPVLRFVPEESIPDLRNSDLHIEEDTHNFDYIFALSQLANPDGSKFKEKRHLSNRFVREYPHASFEIRDLKDSLAQEQIIEVLRRWENKKRLDNKPYDLGNEETALNRLLKNIRDGTLINDKLSLTCVFSHDVMLGFGIDEILPHKYAMSHFVKADNSFKGIYEFLNENLSRYLLTQGVDFWNWQQDLNIEGLQTVKKSYRPINVLKKYTVSLS